LNEGHPRQARAALARLSRNRARIHLTHPGDRGANAEGGGNSGDTGELLVVNARKTVSLNSINGMTLNCDLTQGQMTRGAQYPSLRFNPETAYTPPYHAGSL